MRIKLFLTLALASTCVAAIMAQTPPTAPTPPTPPSPAKWSSNRVARLTALLSLTTAQQASATTIFTNEESSAQTSRESMMAAHQTLQAAIQSGDSSAISNAAQQIGQLTGTGRSVARAGASRLSQAADGGSKDEGPSAWRSRNWRRTSRSPRRTTSAAARAACSSGAIIRGCKFVLDAHRSGSGRFGAQSVHARTAVPEWLA